MHTVALDCAWYHTGPPRESISTQGVAPDRHRGLSPCDSASTIKRGTTRRGHPRDVCQHIAGVTERFRVVARNRGCVPQGKQAPMDRSLNAREMRATARMRHVSTATVRGHVFSGWCVGKRVTL